MESSTMGGGIAQEEGVFALGLKAGATSDTLGPVITSLRACWPHWFLTTRESPCLSFPICGVSMEQVLHLHTSSRA